MFKWRKPTIWEYIFVSLIFVILVGMLIPTGIFFGSSKKVKQMMTKSTLINFISNQRVTYQKSGEFYSKEEVMSSVSLSEWNEYGYDIIYETDKKSFQIWLTPKNYEKDGEISFYADSSDGAIHGANHQGKKATINDPIIEKTSDEWKEVFKDYK